MIPSQPSRKVRLVRYQAGAPSRCSDRVAAEEPLEIRIAWPLPGGGVARQRVAVTMRTPGDDPELCVGFLFAEGILRDRSGVLGVSHCAGAGPQQFNVAEVRLAAPPAAEALASAERAAYVGSSCGVCGKAALEQISLRGVRPLPDGGLRVTPAMVGDLPARLAAAQALFQRTGGLHGAALFDGAGELRSAREDIGRHNAVDKVLGCALLAGQMPLAGSVLVVSGRSSFEILQKALAAEVPVVVAVGAPSSLAVELARRFNVTLVGFAREAGFNVYAGEARIG